MIDREDGGAWCVQLKAGALDIEFLMDVWKSGSFGIETVKAAVCIYGTSILNDLSSTTCLRSALNYLSFGSAYLQPESSTAVL